MDYLCFILLLWCYHVSLIAHEPVAMCWNVRFKEAGTYSNIYRLALSGNTLHQSACTQILVRPCGVVQRWSCCWCPQASRFGIQACVGRLRAYIQKGALKPQSMGPKLALAWVSSLGLQMSAR